MFAIVNSLSFGLPPLQLCLTGKANWLHGENYGPVRMWMRLEKACEQAFVLVPRWARCAAVF